LSVQHWLPVLDVSISQVIQRSTGKSWHTSFYEQRQTEARKEKTKESQNSNQVEAQDK
jgi:hypothetical protein